jgi:hypothetical protein
VNDSDFCAVHGGSAKGVFMSAEGAEQSRRCVGRSNHTGSRCKKYALRGSTVCRTHGGYNKFVQAKAQERLDRMVEPVLSQLIDIVNKPGTSDSDRLRAIHLVLDRTMPKEARKVEVAISPWQATMEHVFKQVPKDMDGSPGIIRTLPAESSADDAYGYAPPTLEEIEDAEVIEDDEPLAPITRLPMSKDARWHQPSSNARVTDTVDPPRRERTDDHEGW